MTPDLAPREPAAEDNGIPPALRRGPSAETSRQLAGISSALAQLPQVLAQVTASVRPKLPMCAECIRRRTTWEAKHAPDREAAAQAMEESVVVAMAEHGITERSDPRLPAPDPLAYLPEHLRPHPSLPWEGEHLPAIMDSVTMAGGTWVCQWDIPGAPRPGGADVARRPFLIANSFNVSALAREAAQAMPGVPGQ